MTDTTKPHIRLATTTFNEAKSLPALAEGCKPFIDSWIILDDLESNDGTAELAEELFSYAPGEVIRVSAEEFKSSITFNGETHRFLTLAAKRNHLLDICREGLAPTDYLFMTQSDEPPTGMPDKSSLTEPVYCVSSREGVIEYFAPILMQSQVDARWFGRCHEYFQVPSKHTPPCPGNLYVTRYGSSVVTELDNDLRLAILTEDWEADHNPRWLFYMAQTLLSMNKKPEALWQYMKRAAIQSDMEEETWYSAYMAAIILTELDTTMGEHLLLRLALGRPNRPEPYYHLSYIRNAQCNHEQARFFAAKGLSNGWCSDALFVNRWHETQGLKFELNYAEQCLLDPSHDQTHPNHIAPNLPNQPTT